MGEFERDVLQTALQPNRAPILWEVGDLKFLFSIVRVEI